MIGIVIATHCGIASALTHAAQVVLGPLEGLVPVDLAPESSRDQAWAGMQQALQQADQGQGVLVLVDMLGGTPSNLALALLAEGQVEVITGVNLPMVLRAAQHRGQSDLATLSQDVLAYGRRNVTSATSWLKPESPSGG
ncbi:hypothetical protein L6R53_20675 [Myxococcota bacterium]|nr:hypothetical protein [Myxococcota bacterium]